MQKYITIANNSSTAFNNFQNEIRKQNINDWLDKSVDCDVNKNYDIFEKYKINVNNKTMPSKTVSFNLKKHKGNDLRTYDILDLIIIQKKHTISIIQTNTLSSCGI